MILCVPVVDCHDLTKVCIRSILDTTTPDTRVVIFDNNSEVPYTTEWIDKHFYDDRQRIILYRCLENIGYYQPLFSLYRDYPDEMYIGLIHNDMIMYEPEWDVRLRQGFEADPLLGLVGLCGSYELDALGGRGGGTMCYFSGRSVIVGDRQILAQSQDAGLRINDIRPALVLDSLFMMFHRAAVLHLVRDDEKWEDITLAHFYDRIWPLRVIEGGYRVAVAGVECDHLGGMTSTGNERYRQDCITWLDAHGITYDNPETEMYLVAERRFLHEYRENKKYMPASIGADYAIQHRIPRS